MVAINRCLITGFQGVGKTTTGKALAAKLGWRFFDTDDLVQAAHGSILKIFADEGEAAFRTYEAEAVSVATRNRDTHCVIALGGGSSNE